MVAQKTSAQNQQRTLKPRTFFCHDNLPILRGINSNSIDLIYLDPPFNKGRKFHAPVGTTAEGAEFDDIWRLDSVKDEWHNEINDRFPSLYKYLDAVGAIGSRPAKYYLIYMAARLMELQRILKDSGTLYLHCDPTASHYLKLLLDTIFGHAQFKNEIIWCYTGPSGARRNFPQKHDVIFRYTKSRDCIFNADDIRIPYKSLHSDKGQNAAIWGKSGKLQDSDERQKYLMQGKVPEDFWLDIPSGGHISPKERIGYPTQKPLALIERIIKASSDQGDMVLDPFCGCATTCVAAEKLGRLWVGVDVSQKTFELVKSRLRQEVPPDLFRGAPLFRSDTPTRTDIAFKRLPTPRDKQTLYGMQNGACKGCGTRFEIQHLELDHIIPRSAGGGNEMENLQLLCGHCNRLKGARPMEYLRARLKYLAQ